MPAAGDVVYLTYKQQDGQGGLLLRLAAVMQGLKQSVAELQLHRQQSSRRLQAAASGAAQAPMAAPGPGLGAGPASSADQQPSRGAGPADGPALGPVPPQQALVSWLAAPAGPWQHVQQAELCQLLAMCACPWVWAA